MLPLIRGKNKERNLVFKKKHFWNMEAKEEEEEEEEEETIERLGRNGGGKETKALPTHPAKKVPDLDNSTSIEIVQIRTNLTKGNGAPQSPAKEPTTYIRLRDMMTCVSIGEVIGQDHVVGSGQLFDLLYNSIDNHPSYIPSIIITGPPGSGKTTLATLYCRKARRRIIHINKLNASLILNNENFRSNVVCCCNCDGMQKNILMSIKLLIDICPVVLTSTTMTFINKVNLESLFRGYVHVVRLNRLDQHSMIEIGVRALNRWTSVISTLRRHQIRKMNKPPQHPSKPRASHRGKRQGVVTILDKREENKDVSVNEISSCEEKPHCVIDEHGLIVPVTKKYSPLQERNDLQRGVTTKGVVEVEEEEDEEEEEESVESQEEETEQVAKMKSIIMSNDDFAKAVILSKGNAKELILRLELMFSKMKNQSDVEALNTNSYIPDGSTLASGSDEIRRFGKLNQGEEVIDVDDDINVGGVISEEESVGANNFQDIKSNAATGKISVTRTTKPTLEELFPLYLKIYEESIRSHHVDAAIFYLCMIDKIQRVVGGFEVFQALNKVILRLGIECVDFTDMNHIDPFNSLSIIPSLINIADRIGAAEWIHPLSLATVYLCKYSSDSTRETLDEALSRGAKHVATDNTDVKPGSIFVDRSIPQLDVFE